MASSSTTNPTDIRHQHALVEFTGGEPYNCNGCQEDGYCFGFRCQHPSCHGFTLHNCCAQLAIVYHSTYTPERLNFKKSSLCQQFCSACKKPLKGFYFRTSHGPTYTWRFHPLCIMLPEFLTFSKHENDCLQLVKVEKGRDYTCGFCGERNRGWRYACEQHDYSLDLTCAKLYMQGLLQHPPQGQGEGQGEGQAIPQGGNWRATLQVAGALVARFGVSFAADVAADLV